MNDLQEVIDEIIAANPDKAEQARNRPAQVGWFVAQVMKALDGKADSQVVEVMVKTNLGIVDRSRHFSWGAGDIQILSGDDSE